MRKDSPPRRTRTDPRPGAAELASGEGHTAPGFGQADLTNCEREQIHLAGSIQPHGALLVVRERDQVVVQASANAREFLRLDGDVLEYPLDRLDGDLSDATEAASAEPVGRHSRGSALSSRAAVARNTTVWCIGLRMTR